ncbi:Transmembrane protein [Halotydeus destructor]|nr:Transmembrane protein [Halotydeus destructor]
MAGRLVSQSTLDKAAVVAFVAASGGVTALYLGLHYPFLGKYQSYVQMYSEGRPKQLSPELKERTLQVLREAKIARRKKPDVKFFHVYGDDVFHAGSLELAGGSIIGIPFNFTYKSTDDINTREVKVFNGQPVKWDTKTGKKLLDSLVLSPKAQKFAIAREVYQTDSHQVPLECGAILVSMVLAKAMSDVIKKARNMTAKPLAARILVYFMATCFGWTNYCLLSDSLNVYYESKADERAVLSGDEYYDGGIEYYTKLLNRNKAFRKFMGASGENYFTPDGDEKDGLIRTTKIPLTKRLYKINEVKNPTKEEY